MGQFSEVIVQQKEMEMKFQPIYIGEFGEGNQPVALVGDFLTMEMSEWNNAEVITKLNTNIYLFFCIEFDAQIYSICSLFHQIIFKVVSFVQSRWTECCTEKEASLYCCGDEFFFILSILSCFLFHQSKTAGSS